MLEASLRRLDVLNGLDGRSSAHIISNLPPFVKPLPAILGPDEVTYLESKRALAIPAASLRSELLRGAVDFVLPHLPILNQSDFLSKVDATDGSHGQLSLVLLHAVFFVGCPFASMQTLQESGYRTRKEASRDFFQRARVSGCVFAANENFTFPKHR